MNEYNFNKFSQIYTIDLYFDKLLIGSISNCIEYICKGFALWLIVSYIMLLKYLRE